MVPFFRKTIFLFDANQSSCINNNTMTNRNAFFAFAAALAAAAAARPFVPAP
jgi:hypothetical protein